MREETQKQRLLLSTIRMHEQLAEILAHKALEAEKARNWLCGCLAEGDPLKPCLAVHEQVVEMLEGIARVESGIVGHLKILLGEEESGGGMDMFGGKGEEPS
ncbi:restriction endonuclease subunit S [Xylanibacillus composti]|uniref:Restriction endonuclease subunit S n=1 Tax=Xylanibacillus composti TaxID=1572762 RepID=A0A8J4M2G4_9BACL|nr:restriction endonuclease subunit S [Xylanibacillus composti]MDT9723453.1 restriction endonuclease subunit S [Xylanibacillus composti]GIQ68511.1 hypothetical protein XYCOK13_13350 [Xylanibacillus composti]